LREFERGLDASKRAVELNPSSATCARVLGFSLLHSGDAAGAMPQFGRALMLSPRDPETWSFCHGLAMSHLALRQFEPAVLWSKRAIVSPNPGPWSHVTRAAALGHLGRSEQAHDAWQTFLGLHPSLATVEAAVKQTARLSRSEYVEVLSEGLLLAKLGATQASGVVRDPPLSG
jgi:Flp pilus assembly protein TadD